MRRIAIIVTTMHREEMLSEAVASMIKNSPENSVILIGDQGHKDGLPPMEMYQKYNNGKCYYYCLPYDCGLSYARNFLLERAKELECDYSVIASDSMIFTESTKNLSCLINKMDEYDCIGCHLNGGVPIYWVGWLTLKPRVAFELDFIDRDKYGTDFFPCSIVHNFFIAKTASLLTVKWDETLKLAEHEDFFYRYGQAGYKVAWTPRVSCDYKRSREGQQGILRAKNWHEGLLKLYAKWHINHWIDYKNRDYGFWGVTK